MEGASPAHFALHPNPPSHQLAPTSTETANPKPVPPNRRVVELSTWLNDSKNALVFVGRDADSGVLHGAVQPHAAAVRAIFQPNVGEHFAAIR